MRIANKDNPMAPYSFISLVPGGEQAEHQSEGKLPAYFKQDQLYNIKDEPAEQKNLAKDEAHKEIYE